jgi:hypothetical protein
LAVRQGSSDGLPEVLTVIWIVPVGELVDKHIVHKPGRELRRR